MKLRYSFFIILTIFISIFSQSCSDDYEPSRLGGTWQLFSSYHQAYTSTSGFENTPIDVTFVFGHGYDIDMNLIFDDRTNTYYTSGEYSVDFQRTTAQGEIVDQVWTDQTFLGSGSWEYDGRDSLFYTQNGNLESEGTYINFLDPEGLIHIGYSTTFVKIHEGVPYHYLLEGNYVFKQ